MEPERKTEGNERPVFDIEHHAVLFGLFAKHADMLFGEAGLDAIGKAVSVYGSERGARMALRTLRDGRPLSLENYLAYAEWHSKPGQMDVREAALSPVYKTTVTRCEWNESWRKHGLAKYGPLYCRFIDHHLVKGYSDDLDFRVESALSEGAEKCDFTWNGVDLGGEKKADFDRKKKALGEKNVKNFGYHAAHLYGTLKRVLSDELGDGAAEIPKLALRDFARLFGGDRAAVVEAGEKTDFTRI